MKRYSPEQLAKQAASEAKWRAVLADWKSSKLDGRGYCREKRISEHVFYHWKRVIRLREQGRISGFAHDEPRAAAPQPPVRAKIPRKTGAQRPLPRFLPIHLKVPGSIELRHTSGHVLILHDGCGEELLRRTLSALERTC